MEKLREELEKLSEDYANMTVAKNKLEAQNSELGQKSGEQDAKVAELEEKALKMKATIKELEKRRDAAIKEIRSLKHQIRKDQKA